MTTHWADNHWAEAHWTIWHWLSVITGIPVVPPPVIGPARPYKGTANEVIHIPVGANVSMAEAARLAVAQARGEDVERPESENEASSISYNSEVDY